MLLDFIDIGMVRGIGTALVLIAFTCVTLWAYSGKRAKAFDDAANLPFADEPKKQASRNETP